MVDSGSKRAGMVHAVSLKDTRKVRGYLQEIRDLEGGDDGDAAFR